MAPERGVIRNDLASEISCRLSELAKRIDIPLTASSPPGLVQANAVDPWSRSGKYGLAWTYFSLSFLGAAILVRIWHLWQDKIRQAIYKEERQSFSLRQQAAQAIRDDGGSGANADADVDADAAIEADAVAVANLPWTQTKAALFPTSIGSHHAQFRPRAHLASVGLVNDALALFRWIFYRPIPDIVWRRHRLGFSSLAVLSTVLLALAFVVLYCFLQQPLFWQSIRFGSPPLAIRSGNIAVAMTPWIIATSMKANILTTLTGIGPERLNVLHRWLGYLCLFLSLMHTVPFYVQPVWADGGMQVFNSLFPPGGGVVTYGTGFACLVPLIWLCLASLPWVRRLAYDLFVLFHIPVAILYLGLLFWHSRNSLMSWGYLFATVGIWFSCSLIRLFHLNWTRPWRQSFLVGDEASIRIMSENAIKMTIPTQMRWRPGQYVYLRMPGISFLESHPFTISSLCSDDLPSEYGDQYRDCILLFKPYRGFTGRVLETALAKGPLHCYRAFLDGPYGGMRRDLAAFDACVLIAGGSGITGLMSQLLSLVKRMRDGKAITRKVIVVWALRRLEALDWFREELRICRESAPPGSVRCRFYVTSAVRHRPEIEMATLGRNGRTRVRRDALHDKVDTFVAGIASKRNSSLMQVEVGADGEREPALRVEDEERKAALPRGNEVRHPPSPPPLGHLKDGREEESPSCLQGPSLLAESAVGAGTGEGEGEKSDEPCRVMAPPEFAHLRPTRTIAARPTSTFGPPSGFDFGFPKTPTEIQRSLLRSAFPVPHLMDGGWTVEYGRPDLGYMLKQWATGGTGGRGMLGRRTAVFVCGPPSMRIGVGQTVARLQAEIWGDDELEEIFLHTENYAL